jgi:hypothetical protein
MNSALDESVLDDERRLAAADRTGLLRSVATAGAQIRESMALSAEADVPAVLSGIRPRAVLVAVDPGADDVAVALAGLADRPDSAAPVVRQDGPVLPVWAGATDALLAATTAATATAPPALVKAGPGAVSLLGARPADSLLHGPGRNRAGYVALPGGRTRGRTSGRRWSRCCSPPAAGRCPSPDSTCAAPPNCS